MQKEVAVAVEWWAEQLKDKPKFDNGEPFHGAMFGLIKHDPLSDEQIENFKSKLRLGIHKRVADVWDIKNPDFGSSLRCIGVDYGPDKVLSDACKDAGFSSDNRFPVKTNMWIDPYRVRVSCGYRAQIETIWSKTQEQQKKDEV
jgi:hypothetical protein